ncbi:MAG: VOC family protein [Albidovulum sp.]
MAKPKRGKPCWYELTTHDPDGSAHFYGQVLGWATSSAGMEGFDYRLARAGGDMVAGLMPATPEMPAFWMIYLTVTNCDKTATAIARAGGSIHRAPADIPGTGRFAIVVDPQGAAFGILQPLDDDSRAYAQMQAGHGCWHELMTSDPKAAMAFYGKHFGWKPGDSIDMGPMGNYDLFRHGKSDIGGMMKRAPGMPGPDHPFWLPYFGTDGVAAAIDRVVSAGGQSLHGPHEVPGGAFIMVGRDPQGALFALVGPN